MARTAITGAVADGLVERQPATSRPTLDPTSASIEISPLALPRLPVGNSSAP